ncbi:hypothetical protein M501DRAFT_736717 [Patellaria atrata CBS 101060]|uniref:Uncharacterized protein n=1 Tax=Patellaria atrata CBS 101060 TaxID=1346257 RepID=A0A9P4SBY0_9PEZI|nr:hypothetical protein M501DRAFT_736717 [Patellaria atrata CBS 101060]
MILTETLISYINVTKTPVTTYSFSSSSSSYSNVTGTLAIIFATETGRPETMVFIQTLNSYINVTETPVATYSFSSSSSSSSSAAPPLPTPDNHNAAELAKILGGTLGSVVESIGTVAIINEAITFLERLGFPPLDSILNPEFQYEWAQTIDLEMENLVNQIAVQAMRTFFGWADDELYRNFRPAQSFREWRQAQNYISRSEYMEEWRQFFNGASDTPPSSNYQNSVDSSVDGSVDSIIDGSAGAPIDNLVDVTSDTFVGNMQNWINRVVLSSVIQENTLTQVDNSIRPLMSDLQSMSERIINWRNPIMEETVVKTTLSEKIADLLRQGKNPFDNKYKKLYEIKNWQHPLYIADGFDTSAIQSLIDKFHGQQPAMTPEEITPMPELPPIDLNPVPDPTIALTRLVQMAYRETFQTSWSISNMADRFAQNGDDLAVQDAYQVAKLTSVAAEHLLNFSNRLTYLMKDGFTVEEKKDMLIEAHEKFSNDRIDMAQRFGLSAQPAVDKDYHNPDDNVRASYLRAPDYHHQSTEMDMATCSELIDNDFDSLVDLSYTYAF